jgi:predicted transcriptional regulator
MEVHLTTEQLSQLSEVAKAKGRDTDVLVQEVLSRYLEEEARFVEAVKRGEAELDRGEYLTHEQVGQRIENLFKR